MSYNINDHIGMATGEQDDEPSMTPIPPIPGDLKDLYDAMLPARELPLDGCDGEHFMLRVHARSTCNLIERIAKLTAEVERLIDKERETQAKLTRSALDVLALSSENTRLKAPVSDEEWNNVEGISSNDRRFMLNYEICTAIIRSRTTRTPPQEGQADKPQMTRHGSSRRAV